MGETLLRPRHALIAALLAALLAVPAIGAPDGATGPAVADATARVAATAPTDACGVRPKRPDGTYYACSFIDGFGGTALDRRKWAVTETKVSAMSGGSLSCYVDNSRTIAVGNGVLRLTSTYLPTSFRCKSPGTTWATRAEAATITTRSLFTQTNGRFEARIKMPAEAGIAGSHSAFWLYPQELTYGRWPASGEVDIAEWFSAKADHVYPSVHYGGEIRSKSTGYDCAMPTSSTAFHTYAVEWNKSEMKFSFDGKVCFTHAWKPFLLRSPKPFDKPFYMVLTQVWGKAWNTRVSAMPSKSTMQVDWVKVWK
jgi:beta-glucanase (GH16 family)